MNITRKAATGFILLAAILFPMGYFGYGAIPHLPPPHLSNVNLSTDHINSDTPQTDIKSVTFVSPLIPVKSPLEMAIAITGITEIFALLCYFSLKKMETAINEAAEKAMRDLKNRKAG